MSAQYDGACQSKRGTASAITLFLILISAAVVVPAQADTSIAAAVLPVSRSVTTNQNATLFASIVNAGDETATGCHITNDPRISGAFSYQTTDPATNTVTGTINTPADIPAGGVQSFLISLSSTLVLAPTDVEFGFVCANSDPAPVFPGVNTLLFSASADYQRRLSGRTNRICSIQPFEPAP